MKKPISLAGLAIVSSLVAMAIATSSNAQPAMTDTAYCTSLVKALSMGGESRGSLMVDTDTAVAIAQCQEGNPKPAIPVLERKLRDNRIPVPSRS